LFAIIFAPIAHRIWQLETEHNAKLTLRSVENPWTLFLHRSGNFAGRSITTGSFQMPDTMS
jgi:hypothetical protein